MTSVFVSLLLVTGCSNKDETKEQTKQEEIQVESESEQEELKDMEENITLTKQLSEEKGVSEGKVFEKEGKQLARFIVEKELNEEETKKLVHKYAKELQTKYKDQEVNVQAIKGMEIIEEVSIKVKNTTTSQGETKVKENQKTAQDLNATVINTVPGVFAIKISLEEAKVINATEISNLSLEVPGKSSVPLTYKPDHKVFFNSNIQGGYTQDELLNSVVLEIKK